MYGLLAVAGFGHSVGGRSADHCRPVRCASGAARLWIRPNGCRTTCKGRRRTMYRSVRRNQLLHALADPEIGFGEYLQCRFLGAEAVDGVGNGKGYSLIPSQPTRGSERAP